MKKTIKCYFLFTEILNKLLAGALVLIFSVMVVVMSSQVFSRFVLGSSISWSEELSRFLMIYLVVMGSAYAIKDNGLISVEVLKDKLKGKRKVVLESIIGILNSVFLIIIIYYGFKISAEFVNQKTPGLKISMSYIYFALPLGGILMLINQVGLNLKQFSKEVE